MCGEKVVKTKKIAIIGFGAMGCRHAQSLINNPQTASWEIFAVETSEDNFKLGLQKIGADETRIQRVESIIKLPDGVDMVIVATSSGPRFNIMNQLLDKGIRFYLLEKIVFQSLAQFDHIIQRMKQLEVVAYCNFVNRYFDNYNHIRKQIQANPGIPVEMTVTGGEFGLGCNAIHYIDLFEYLTSSTGKVTIEYNLLEELESGNKRGTEYKEFNGSLAAQNDKKQKLRITSFKAFETGIVINIRLGDHILHQLNENMSTAVEYNENGIRNHVFNLLPTSKLTAIICQDIFNGTCRLSTVQETRHTHAQLFGIFNNTLKLENKNETICPIT
jgi:predicted dehydrogenase